MNRDRLTNSFRSIIAFISKSKQALVFAGFALLILLGCSTKRDGVAYRIYHNTTGRFNGYYNANELIKKTQHKLATTRKDDYDEVLPLYNYGTPEVRKELTPDLDKALKKCERVVKRHTLTPPAKKGMKWPEFNKWMDDNYVVIGQSQFYKGDYFKANETFNFIANKYSSEEVQARAYVWQIRTLIQDAEFSKAKQLMLKLNGLENLPKALLREKYMVTAEYFMAQLDYEKAIEPLQLAIPLFNKKTDRVLPQFILGQCYSRLERGSDAKVAFQTVLKMKPTYELEFQSKLQILLTDLKFRGNYEQAIKQLLVMLEDVKNESYKDVIYYALGTTALSAEKNKEAVDYFEQSLVYNKVNKKKRVKTFLTLADLYFDQRQYVQAQVYYDSTYKNLAENHERFKEVKARAQSLNELVGYLNTIEKNDSLATLCSMTTAEIDKKLDRIHDQMVQEMEEKKRLDEEARLAALKGEEVNGTFWIYNADVRERGKRQFDDVWGGRPLKDYWGIQAQLNNMFSSPDESQLAATANSATVEADSLKYKVPSVEDLKKELPCGDTKKMEKMGSDLTDAYYQSGLVYKEKLDDIESAITSWESMLRKTPESGFTPMAYYQLFRAWMFKEQNGSLSGTCETCSSAYWGAAIKKKYPGSDWAMLVDNPDYVNAEQMRREEEEKQYKKAYGLYANNGILESMAICDKAINERPNNHLICQYRLLRASCLGKLEVPYGTTVGFEEELNRIVTNCPGSEQAAVATTYLNQLKNKSGSTTNTNVTTSSKTFVKADEGEHYVVAVVDANTDLNKAKIALSNFNSTYFSTFNYKTSTAMFDVKTPMLLVKSFPNLKEANDYFTTFVGDQELATALGLVKTSPVFIITKQNYQELFRTKDFPGYLEFFKQNY